MEEQGVLIELKRCEAEEQDQAGRRAESGPKIKQIDREQSAFVSIWVENLIGVDDKVRAIWDLTGRMDLSRLYEKIVSRKGEAGQAAEDPRLLVAIWVWSYSEGISSSRQVEHLLGQEPGLMWLCGLRTMSHATLANFRKDHKAELDGLFTQLLALLETAGAISLDRVMHDSTKIRSRAGEGSFRRQGALETNLEKAQAAVEQMSDPERGAEGETNRQQKARQRAAQERLERMEKALAELEQVQSGKKTEEEKQEARVSSSEPEARRMKHRDGSFSPSYSGQITTEASNKVIVAVSITQNGSDANMLEPAMDLVKQNLGRDPQQAVADGGYTNRETVKAMEARGIDFIGSMGNYQARQSAAVMARGIDPNFAPQFFILQAENNTLRCPADKQLQYAGQNRVRGDLYYSYRAAAGDCVACVLQRQCCPKQPEKGRMVARRVEEAPVMARFRRKMETEEAKGIYRQRAEVAEFPNAWIKEKIGLRRFSLRGLAKAGTELLWACLTYNALIWARVCWRDGAAASN